MSRFLWLRTPDTPGWGDRPKDESVSAQIRALPEGRRWPIETLAHPERRSQPGAGGDPLAPITLWADPYRTRVYAHLVPQAAGKGSPVTYHVTGAAGEHLATITYEPALRGGRLRPRWTVRQTGAPEAVGLKGRMVWWWLWWLLAPVHIPLAIALSFTLEEDIALPFPRRIRWRTGGTGRAVLDWRRVGRRNESVEHDSRFSPWLHVAADWWDPRVAAALLALLS
ncbi:hypothetical protein [Streptomyces sp. S465]|uniref:hypothetical protein n=1 Tax=Streptomyces sp. S465 TaxID=2979468 RepID=UPI0022A82051|nr:hypothetical protein [Streptomyces sp. S465]WAP58652.1 hypothetical protein N6H00_28880 [Streptomyces sp. S465]